MGDILKHTKPNTDSIEISFTVIDDTYSKEFSEEYLYCQLMEEVNLAKVISIPFTLYGINPGDIIRFEQKDVIPMFKSKVRDGNTYTYRIALANSENHDKHSFNRDRVVSLLENLIIKYEQMNVMIIAACAKNREIAVSLENELITLQQEGIILGYDTAR